MLSEHQNIKLLLGIIIGLIVLGYVVALLHCPAAKNMLAKYLPSSTATQSADPLGSHGRTGPTTAGARDDYGAVMSAFDAVQQMNAGTAHYFHVDEDGLSRLMTNGSKKFAVLIYVRWCDNKCKAAFETYRKVGQQKKNGGIPLVAVNGNTLSKNSPFASLVKSAKSYPIVFVYNPHAAAANNIRPYTGKMTASGFATLDTNY